MSSKRANRNGELLRPITSIAFGFSLLACEVGDETARVTCVKKSAQAITSGSVRAEYLKLESWQAEAVVAVELELDAEPFADRCSGVLIAPSWVLTAAHCAHGAQVEPSSRVAFGALGDGLVAVKNAVVHDELDVMLLELEASLAETPELQPLAVARELPHAFGAGSLVQSAGFGYDAQARLGRRAFLVERTVFVEERELIVTADGLGGACSGDSGGPLLARATNGTVIVVGVLSRGSASCYGEDIYARLDGVSDWIDERTGGAAVAAAGVRYAQLGAEGRCFGEVAVWSSTGESTESEVCRDGLVCGWDASALGYRCIAADDDPCGGVSELGTCDGDRASRCERGELRASPCGACGATCARSPQSGVVQCRETGS